jgi:chaperonin GroEL
MIYEKTKAKDLIYDPKKIQEIVSETMHKMAVICQATLGPAGRPVLIERDGMSPLITKDGVTVARSLGVANAECNIIIEAAKEICLNTAKEAGDGTTTAIILADAITKYGMQFLKENPKYNPQRVVSELKKAYLEVVVPFLKDDAIKVETNQQLKEVAKISANGDEAIAQVVVDAVLAAGDDGTVLLEEGQGDILKMETMDGYVVTSGLKELGQIGPIFINDRSNQQVKADNGLVFLYDGSMNDLKVPGAIQDQLENLKLTGTPLIVFAHDFADVVLERIAKTAKGGMVIVPVKTPMSGMPNGRSMFLCDMAAYTGAKVYDAGNLSDMQNDEISFGSFDDLRVNMYETFIGCTIDAERVDKRVAELKSISEAAFSELDKMHLRAAIGKLIGGVSTIWVGGSSELEIREKKSRVEDAVEAVRSAIKEGIVPGGCYTHLRLSNILERKPLASWHILAKALREPFNVLITNCGEFPEQILDELVTKQLQENKITIFDAENHVFVDPFEAGIIEPAKVVRVSICNALSVASLLMTLGGIVVVPRDYTLENQLEMSKQTFKDMMSGGGIGE